MSDVLRTGAFWRVALGFGLCGFHVCFLSLHMPGVIERCGLPASLAALWVAVCGAANIAGSLLSGLAMKRCDAACVLVVLHAVRALGVAALLLLGPSPTVLLGFAAVMGATLTATVPPTSQLIARAHGGARLGTLFGFVMLVHQVGGFAGVWLGGWAAEASGSDTLMWTVDIVLAIGAAALAWPRRQTVRAPRNGIAERFDFRRAQPGDLDALQAFVAALSVRTRRQRFFVSAPRLPQELVRAIEQGDPHHRLFVAEREGDVVALGQYAVDRDEARCEVAIVVADAWQGCGLGRRLLAHLLDDAARWGLREAVLETMHTNHPMQALARRLGFELKPHPEDAELVFGRRQLVAG